ncbi:hypothetical protein LCGC14_1382190 [marine sediment metagenome]|uniref:Uncharacterized protein n=1 Tax=marine sediment metagenome TaxID=412755 RepID=A0A0F9KN70_9ZZZZ
MNCPILKAGTMIKSYEKSLHFEALTHYESAECMGDNCEWFEHGCPAHPITKEVRDKIRAIK